MRIICPEDSEWPPGFADDLSMIRRSLLVIVRAGRIEPHDTVAIGVVGSGASARITGARAGGKGVLARLLGGAGFTVNSGGARGIDTGAHHGALRAKARTVVVLGCGHGHTYPPENKGLFERIVAEDRGAILSELPLRTPPNSENFLPRNRIIAGMSLGVLVIEANIKSGSLTTARLAGVDYGREVFALPGPVNSPTSAGTHQLIKTGSATLVDSLDDI